MPAQWINNQTTLVRSHFFWWVQCSLKTARPLLEYLQGCYQPIFWLTYFKWFNHQLTDFKWFNHHHHHKSLNCEGSWGTTEDFTTSFLLFSLFSTALWDLAGLFIPWCCLLTPSSVCLVFFPLSLCLARWFWTVLMNRRHDHTTAVYISLRWSGLPVVSCLLDLGMDFLSRNIFVLISVRILVHYKYILLQSVSTIR